MLFYRTGKQLLIAKGVWWTKVIEIKIAHKNVAASKRNAMKW